jgi:hypothetical protein
MLLKRKGDQNMIIQLSIFVPNRPGELFKITEMLAANNIQIRALTVAETADFGIFRMIVSDPEKCFKILSDHKILVGKTEVIAVEMEDKPGGLNKIAKLLGDGGINIEYLYGFASKKAVLVVQVSRDQAPKAVEILTNAKITQFKPEEIYNL